MVVITLAVVLVLVAVVALVVALRLRLRTRERDAAMELLSLLAAELHAVVPCDHVVLLQPSRDHDAIGKRARGVVDAFADANGWSR